MWDILRCSGRSQVDHITAIDVCGILYDVQEDFKYIILQLLICGIVCYKIGDA